MSLKERRKLRKAAIKRQNQAAGRGNHIPKIVEVLNKMRDDAEKAEREAK